MKKIVIFIITSTILFSCSLDPKGTSLNNENYVTTESRGDTGFILPVCKKSYCPNKGKEMTKFVKVIFKDRNFSSNADYNCSRCERFHDHTSNYTVSLNLYQCTGCGTREGGARTFNTVCSSSYPVDMVQFPDYWVEKKIRIVLNKPTGYITKSDLLTIKELNYFFYYYPEDLNGLQLCTNLEELTLFMSSRLIEDLTPLKDLKKLKKLSLGINKVSDLSPLKDITSLEILSLSRNNVVDISHLKNLTNLTSLILDENQIKDITPIKNLPNLKVLDITNNNMNVTTDSANKKVIDYLKNKTPSCIVRWEEGNIK